MHLWLEINGTEAIDGISRRMREAVGDTLRKKGVVVPVSGGDRIAKPTTDTYSLEQEQDEFFFALSYDKMEMVLCGMNNGMPADRVAMEIGLTADQVERVFQDIRTKRRTTHPLHMKPVLMEPVLEIEF